jgi:branched-chain amino acid transport system substrate-binding protein
VLGSVRHPLNTPDFAAFLQQAKASGAKVIGLADAGGDTVNAIKQAREFGLVAGGQRLAALLFDLGVADALGLEAAQGLQFVEAFYWDLNDGTRAFSRRFADRFGGRPPHQLQAGVYGAVLHYLKAVRASGTDSGAAVVAKMKELPTDDPLFGKGSIRADGRALHPMYLFEVKSPAESKGPWDYYKLVRTIPAEEAFRPLDQGGCPMVAKKG